MVVDSLDEVKGKKTTSYVLVNSKPINKNGDTIKTSKKTDETIVVAPVRVFSKDDLTVTKEIIKNNDIKVTGVVIVGVDK